jgi:hypothetical protein
VCFAILTLAMSTSAATLVPVTTSDSGEGSLREAIEIANQESSSTIDLRALTGRIALESPLPLVVASIEFLGPENGSLVISGQGQVPILAFADGSTSSLVRLTLSEGRATNYQHGAAISNAGSLTLQDTAVEMNFNDGGWGGAIYNNGRLLLFDSLLQGNMAQGEPGGPSVRPAGAGGGAAGMGGAIFHEGGTLLASNVSFIANKAIGGKGGDALVTNAVSGSGRGGGPEGGAEGAFAAPGAGGFGSGGGGGTAAHQFPFPGDGGFGGGSGGPGGVREDGGGAPGGFGGGSTRAAASGGGGGAGMGAAVFVRSGDATFLDCTFTGNTAHGGDGGSGAYGAGAAGSGLGGALFNHGANLVLQRCVVSSNSALGGEGGTIEGPQDAYLRWSQYGGGAAGGGIFLHDGALELEQCLLASNAVRGGRDALSYLGESGVPCQGGALALHAGAARVRQSTISANEAIAGHAIARDDEINPAGSAAGGGLSLTAGALLMENSTVSGNRVQGGDAALSREGQPSALGTAVGGGIAMDGTGAPGTPDLTMRFCTVASNEARRGALPEVVPSDGEFARAADSLLNSGSRGGGCHGSNGILRLEGVILAWNQADVDADLSGFIESINRNLVLDPGTTLGLGEHDLLGIDPLLGQLTQNGGRTPTHLLHPESPAINAIDSAEGIPVDQRGMARPQDQKFDIGAVEAEPPSIKEWALEGDAINLFPAGTGEVTWQMEFSEDLTRWTPVGIVRDGDTFEHSLETRAGFFRLRLMDSSAP